MRVLESTIEKKVVAAAYKKWGIRSIKLNGPGARGWPDRLFLIPGTNPTPLFIEFKAKSGRISPVQKYIHAEMLEAGYVVEVHDDAEEALDAIHRAKMREDG